MFDARAHRDDAADAFRAHDGRQRRPIAIAAGDHQQIVLIDRRGLEGDHHFASGRRPDVSGRSTALTTSTGLPNVSIWIAFMAYLTNTTRPKGRSSIRCRRASAASSSLYARSRIGFTLPELSSGKMVAHAAALTICDCANREKPLMLARFQIKSVTSIVVLRPAEYPSEVRTPWSASVASA